MAYALRSKINLTISDVFRKGQMLSRYTPNVISGCRCYASRDTDDLEETPKPTKYSTSKAHFQSAESARKRSVKDTAPMAQSFSLLISLSAFLIYFGILREENDLDSMIEQDISDKVPDLQKAHDKLKTREGRAAARRNVELTS